MTLVVDHFEVNLHVSIHQLMFVVSIFPPITISEHLSLHLFSRCDTFPKMSDMSKSMLTYFKLFLLYFLDQKKCLSRSTKPSLVLVPQVSGQFQRSLHRL